MIKTSYISLRTLVKAVKSLYMEVYIFINILQVIGQNMLLLEEMDTIFQLT